MELFNVIQGSKEWLELRAKYHRTASRTPIVMGVSPFSNWDKLAAEIKFGIKPYYSAAMKQGNDLEPMIRKRAIEMLGEHFEPQVGVEADFLASLDGINFAGDTIIEIKCSEKTYNDVKSGVIPEVYKWQMYLQMFVFGAKKALLVAYNPNNDDIAISEPLLDDAPVFFEMVNKWNEFETFMETYELPAAIERSDAEWEMVALKLKEIKERQKELAEEEKEYKEALLSLANGENTKGFGVSVYATKKSTTDYKKLIADNNLNVDAYKSESVSWNVRVS